MRLCSSILNVLKLKIKRYIAVEIDDDAHNCLMMHCGSEIEEVVRVDDVRDEDAIVAAIKGNVRAASKWVEVCEVGFNAGHSTLLWFMSPYLQHSARVARRKLELCRRLVSRQLASCKILGSSFF